MCNNLKDFTVILKENGFRVFKKENAETIEFLYFSKDERIGTVYEDFFGLFNFSTVHIPNKHTGTGISVVSNAPLTIENATKSFFMPSWCSNSDRIASVQYKSVESFLKLHMTKLEEI